MTKPIQHDAPGSASSTAGAGYLSEMFCSVQGEGLFLGERQIFLRTAGCTATCSWCDTVYSKSQTPRFVIHDAGYAAGGDEPKRWRPNPVALEDVVADVDSLARANAPVTVVSLTGGEPLEQPEFAAALVHALRAKGFRIHLETAGLHADALRRMIDDVDVIAMDVKLPSATGVEAWDRHRDFLDVLRGSAFDPARNPARTIFVKVVVDPNGNPAEIDRAAELVAACGRSIPFILQPESGALFAPGSTLADRRALLDLIDQGARAAMRRLDTVRVIPQTHKVLHVR
jgi:7-carboxy-7-deazaguanine synthase